MKLYICRFISKSTLIAFLFAIVSFNFASATISASTNAGSGDIEVDSDIKLTNVHFTAYNTTRSISSTDTSHIYGSDGIYGPYDGGIYHYYLSYGVFTLFGQFDDNWTITFTSDQGTFYCSWVNNINPPVISSATVNGTNGISLSYQINASDPLLYGGHLSYTSSSLPSGLNIDIFTGIISGIPSMAGTYPVTVYARNSNTVLTGSAVINIIIAGSGDASLSSLAVSSGNLSPVFSSSTTSYMLSVDNSVSSLAVTPTVNQVNALVKVNGVTVTSGQPSTSINLSVGSNTISVLVTAENGTTTNTYTISVTRAAPVIPSKIAAGISITNTTQTYTSKPITVTTSLSPSTLSAAVVYYPGFNTPTEAGTYYVLVNVVDNTYYGSQSSVLTILPAIQTVSVVTPSSLRVGVPTTLLATSTSNGPISYSVVSGNATVSGSTLIAKDTNPIVIQANQAGTNDYQASSVTATIAASAYSPVAITSNPTNQLVRSGSSATFTVNASGTSPTYQWNLNGTPIAGATSASYTVTASSSATGNYTCTISNDAGSVTTPAATLTLNTTHLQNLSARSIVVTSNLSVGFVSTGASSKSILLRGDGPSLANYGVTGVLANPVLTLYNSSGSSLASNSTWGGASSLSSIFTQVGAFPLSATSNDAVLNQSLSSGTYSAIVTGANSSTGAAMVEIYDADPTGATSRLVNISARGMVGTGSSIMTGGFVISGNSTETVLIRAVGPTLSTYGVTGVLAQPTLTVYNASGTSVATNTIWGGGSTLSSAMTQVGAFALPATSADSAVLVTLPAGAYTVQVSGVNGTTGNALVEIYEVSSP